MLLQTDSGNFSQISAGVDFLNISASGPQPTHLWWKVNQTATTKAAFNMH
jgi:hypothetical protein